MPKLPSVPSLNIKQKVGQLFMPAAFINDQEEEIQRLEQLINTHHIGSICFFHSRASAATNFEGKKEVVHNENSYARLLYLIQRYQKATTIPLLIAIDAEWGLAMRIENMPKYPYAITMGAMQDQESLVFQVGKGIAQDCRKAGIHWNLAPVVDINLNPDNPVIGYRSFGDDSTKVTQYAKAYLKGMRSEGVLNSIKHFPGHGDTATDSHLGLPVINKSKSELLKNELYPFTKLMNEAIDSIMVGHLAVPALSNGKKISSSVSKEIMTNFLRGELGWNGVIISDALNMHAVSKDFPGKGAVEYAAFEAGNDVLCFADNPTEGIEMISEKCSTSRIEGSFNRFWKLKEKAFNHTTSVTEEISFKALMKKLTGASLTLLKGDASDFATFRENGFDFVPLGKSDGLFYDQFNGYKSDNGNVLVSIVPRQVKPKNAFGFTKNELLKIQDFLDTRPTAIYLFGNPFVLNLIPWEKAKVVVVVYQDFDIFQQHAIDHLNNKVEAKGKLPVLLKNTFS